MEEAEKVASLPARRRIRNKVAYGRRTAQKRNISRVHKVYPKPGAQSVPEIQKFPGAQSVPTGPGAQSVPTVDISGGGGGRGGRFPKSPRAAMRQAEPSGLPMWSVPVLTELEWNGDWQRHYGEVTGQTRPAPLLVDEIAGSRGPPSLTPRALAAARPALVRSLIMRRSSCATAA